jgi:hypothetical protein
MAALDTDRIVSARITVRDTLLRFDEISLDDSAVDGATFYVADTWTSGTSHILRVAVVSNSIWAQYSTDISSLGSWSNQSIAVKAGSGIGLFQDKMWYQDASGNMQERVWGGSSFGSATQRTPTNWDTSRVSNFDGVAVNSVYYIQEEYNVDGADNDIYHSHIGLYENSATYEYPGEHYDKTSTILHFFAVRSDNPLNDDADFIFLAVNGGQKAIWMKREGENWSTLESVVPLDIIDDTSQFVVGSAFHFGTKRALAGRVVRSAGTDLQVYMPFHDGGVVADWEAHPTMGREYFICEHSGTYDDMGMRIFYDGDYVWGLGLNNRWRSTPSYYYGTDAAARKVVILGVESFGLGCGHNSSSQLRIELDPADDDPLLDHGNQVKLSVGYDGNYSEVGTFIIENVNRERTEKGQTLELSCIDEVGYRLLTWANDADYDYWGPYRQKTYAKDMATVLRGQGDWEDSGANGLKNIEQTPNYGTYTGRIPCILQSLERPAENGMMMAKFTPGIDPFGYMNQEYGIVMNYYNEQKYEAEERGSPTSFSSYGIEMFAALYGDKAANGNKGIGLFKMMPYTPNIDPYQFVFPTQLDYVEVNLGTQPFWMAMVYTDGEIKVYTRADSVTTWTQRLITRYDYDYHYPYYVMKKRGRAGVWMSNPTYYFQLKPFTRDSLYIPWNIWTGPGGIPGNGELIVDEEILSFDAKDGSASNVNGYNNVFRPDSYTDPSADHDNPYSGPFTGYEIYFTTNDTGTQDHDYYNNMVVAVVDGPGKGNCWKITDYDYVAPKQWVDTGGPYTYPETWKDHVGDTGYGSWQAVAGLRRVFVLEDPGRVLGEGSKLWFMHRLDVDTRALYDTEATSHDNIHGMYYRTQFPVIEDFVSASGERVLTFDYLAKNLARKAGIWDVTSDTIHDETSLVSFSHTGWDLNADYNNYWEEEQDAVIDMYLNSISSGKIGVFSLPAGEPNAATIGYGVMVDDTYMELYKYGPSTTLTLQEQLVHNREMTSKTRLRFVVHDNFISVYIGDAFMWAFYIPTQHEGVTLAGYDPCSAYVRWSKLDTVVDNFICDMGASGMQNIAKLIGEKHINFQHDEGTLHFFKDRVEINDGDPWDLAIEGIDYDDESQIVTRLRMEGVDIYEYIDAVNLKQYGNIFGVANSEEINSLGELQDEAEYITLDNNAGINRTYLGGAADPRVEPDDIIEVTFTGSDRTDTREVIVEGVEFRMQITLDNALFDMTIEGKDA